MNEQLSGGRFEMLQSAGTGAIFTRLNRPLRILAKATMRPGGDDLRAEYAFKQAPRADKLQ